MITLVSHDPEWTNIFNREKHFLKFNCGNQALQIHHIGSTSVNTISAKPIVDILMVVTNINDINEIDGYKAFGEYGIPNRRFFHKKVNETVSINLHVFESHSPEITRHLKFRDLLILNPDIAKQYESLKITLSRQYTNSGEYANAKTNFIASALQNNRITPALELRDISKSYEESIILDGISLSAFPRESIAITGPSGCGKTTLLQICGLIETNFTGSLLIDGQIVQSNADILFARRNKIGFVFQFHNLLPEFTILENAMISQQTSGISDKNYVLSLFEKIGLKDKMHSMPQQLSGGECQRAAIVRALAKKPKLILADEPTGNLDPERGVEIFELLRQFSIESNTSLMIVTHNIELANTLDKKLTLKNRKIVEC